MKTLILGVGNELLSDEGFGVHFIRHLRAHYSFPDTIELLEAGTLGLMIAHKLEEAGRIYIVDALAAPGAPGECHRFTKEDFLLNRVPVKLSPHQVGVQEMLLVSELRGRCPNEVHLVGVIPASLSPGTELSPVLQARVSELARQLVDELRAGGAQVAPSQKTDALEAQ
ncbi:MAG: HyaD/HybD family hydrogenase maturation endopeptidase [Verrucomicrobia bacterium]|nr:HyaD/HybD family hydrogenase maturation endopeptidase [Verrucomicrobiota bacterium]